ncbi:MAG: nucleoside hydrolase [Thermoguttaceae bacterium]
MKRTLLFVGLVLLIVMVAALVTPTQAAAQGSEPVHVIFDTDIGNDVDDVMALAVLHALANRGECKIIGVTITKDHPYAAPMTDAINTFYNKPNIPIGTVRDGATKEEGAYNKKVVMTMNENQLPAFPHDVEPKTAMPEAVSLLRKLLAAEKDNSVVIVQVGFSTNLARLLETKPDAISDLSGQDLVKKKVKMLSIMAGIFDGVPGAKYGHVEYNIENDLPAAKNLFVNWPTEMVVSGFEIGDGIQYPSISMKNDFNYVKYHPVKEAYMHYRGLDNDQPTFDLTSALYAVRPDRGYFDLSEAGTVVLDEKGNTTFQPDANGKHRYMKVSPSQIARVREALTLLVSEPSSKRP